MLRRLSSRQRLVMGLVGQPTRDETLCAIVDGVDSMQLIARRIGREPSTVRWHLGKLRKAGVIERVQVDGLPRYRLKETDDAKVVASAAWVSKEGLVASLNTFSNGAAVRLDCIPELDGIRLRGRGLIHADPTVPDGPCVLTWLGREVARALAQ